MTSHDLTLADLHRALIDLRALQEQLHTEQISASENIRGVVLHMQRFTVIVSDLQDVAARIEAVAQQLVRSAEHDTEIPPTLESKRGTEET